MRRKPKIGEIVRVPKKYLEGESRSAQICQVIDINHSRNSDTFEILKDKSTVNVCIIERAGKLHKSVPVADITPCFGKTHDGILVYNHESASFHSWPVKRKHEFPYYFRLKFNGGMSFGNPIAHGIVDDEIWEFLKNVQHWTFAEPNGGPLDFSSSRKKMYHTNESMYSVNLRFAEESDLIMFKMLMDGRGPKPIGVERFGNHYHWGSRG